MKLSRAILGGLAAATVATGSLSAPAAADDNFGYTWTVTGASDYMFRGVSFTQNDPTVNSYLELTYKTGGLLGTAYLGFWTSNIDNYPETGLGPWEQDIYLGIRPVTGPISWDISVLYYLYGNAANGDELYLDFYPGKTSIWDTDVFEFKAAATITPVTNLTLGAAVYYMFDQEVAAPENISVEGTIAYTLPAWGIFTPTISGLLGHSTAQDSAFWSSDTDLGFWAGQQEYTYWNAGLKLGVEKFTFDFRYWDTDVPESSLYSYIADERFVFTASVTLP